MFKNIHRGLRIMEYKMIFTTIINVSYKHGFRFAYNFPYSVYAITKKRNIRVALKKYLIAQQKLNMCVHNITSQKK